MVTIDSGSEIIRFPKNGHLISAKLTEESNPILTKGLSLQEAHSIDTSIDKTDLYAPTIGLINGLEGYN